MNYVFLNQKLISYTQNPDKAGRYYTQVIITSFIL